MEVLTVLKQSSSMNHSVQAAPSRSFLCTFNSIQQPRMPPASLSQGQTITIVEKRFHSVDTCCGDLCPDICVQKRPLASGPISNTVGLRETSDASVKEKITYAQLSASSFGKQAAEIKQQLESTTPCEAQRKAGPTESCFQDLTHNQDKHSKYEFLTFSSKINQQADNYRFKREFRKRVIRPQFYAGYTHGYGISLGQGSTPNRPSKFASKKDAPPVQRQKNSSKGGLNGPQRQTPSSLTERDEVRQKQRKNHVVLLG